MQEQTTLFEPEPICIPFRDYTRALDRLAPASTCRVMLQMLALTGCRIAELDKMNPRMILDGRIYWYPGKNQRGIRGEHLPPTYLDELNQYRNRHRVSTNRVFGVTAETFTRYFNRSARPQIGDQWINRHKTYINGRGWVDGYLLPLKAFRKTFQTILFNYFYHKYGDAQVALEWVSKRMHHSSEHITAYHYLQNLHATDIDAWTRYLTTGEHTEQKHIIEYLTK